MASIEFTVLFTFPPMAMFMLIKGKYGSETFDSLYGTDMQEKDFPKYWSAITLFIL